MLFPQADWLFRKWLGSIFHLRGGKFAHQKVWFPTVFRCVDRTKHSFFLLFSVRQNFIIKKLVTSKSRNIPYYSSWIIFNCSVLYLLKTLSPIYFFFSFFSHEFAEVMTGFNEMRLYEWKTRNIVFFGRTFVQPQHIKASTWPKKLERS